MKKSILLCLLFVCCTLLFSQEEMEEAVVHSPSNSECFACHGSPTYSYYNENLEHMVIKRMNPYFIIDSVLYYEQNHKSFECVDCHSYDFKEFPHHNELRFEPMPTCLDCHEGDDDYADYSFEQIDEEFHASVHSTKHSDEFTCWMCHNPHSYKINARTNETIKETIIYDNNICLSCHADISKYQLISHEVDPNIISQHEWLPNQFRHFAHVRCIECHTHVNEDILVAHHILPKEEALKKCVECHTKNSILMSSLYKFQAKEKRDKFGFFNAAILSDTYIIGANRNVFLNWISAVIYGGVFLLIFIHAILRFLLK